MFNSLAVRKCDIKCCVSRTGHSPENEHTTGFEEIAESPLTSATAAQFLQGISRQIQMASGSSSVIEVGYNLTIREEDIADVSSALIFRVPKTRRIYNDHLYSPQLVSIGPFHHGKEELKDMEKSKSEAVQRMQTRIQKSIYTEYSSIKSIVEAMELTRMGVKIRPVLDRELEVPATEPALELQLKTTKPSYSAIHLIRFDEKKSTLYLPELRIIAHSYSTMRSIIAMEVNTPAVYSEPIKSRYHPRPMTQFGIFMDELIDTEEDVDVLRKVEVSYFATWAGSCFYSWPFGKG
ncbi:hypothetical protein SUGI_0699020 [Cryptomeria japonica]|nr:hypothetical protein SUGI_0699020 [Cryptomeria japonica]